MRFLYFMLCFLPACGLAQLKLEWQKELDIPGSGLEAINGLILDSRHNLCVVANQSGTKVFSFSEKTEPTEIYSIPSYLWWVEPQGNNLIAREGDCISERSFNTGMVIEKNCYQMPPDWATTSPVGRVYNSAFYYTEYYFLCKFKKNGEVVFKKELAESGNSHLLRAGGGYIYIYGSYSPGGFRLMQYDTLGNAKWSVPTGGVYTMVTDNDGNCYIMVANGETTVVKFNPAGEVVWSKLLKGQWAQGASIHGDSLLLCGNISLNAITDKNQSCAYSIMSANSGEILHQQVVDLYEDKNEREKMTAIATDGKAIYIGGTHSDENPQCFLVKLSSEGSTGLKGEKITRSFSIFPNPGGSRFTISCDDPGTGTIKVTVRNGLGQLIQKKEIPCEGQKSWELDLGKQPAGHYSIEIVSSKDRTVKKVVVE